MNKRFFLFLCLGFCLLSPGAHAFENPFSFDENRFTKEEKLLYTNIGAFIAVTAWGTVNWDYFSRTPHIQNEGWFSEDTKEGGADKVGHFYSSYLISHLFAHTYEKWGYSRNQSALYGALSSFGIQSWVEFGDSFSEYGFSYEDFIMNFLGTVAGYYLYSYPELSEKIDFRFEYFPRFDKADIFTDYNNSKVLMAVKLDGFEFVTNKYLQYLELHLGYYVREHTPGHKDRNLYVGFGINLSKIFDDLSMKKTATFTRYFQIPYTYVEAIK